MSKEVFETLSPESFLNQLALMNVSEQFKNTCKILLNNYVHGKNINHEIQQALISIMLYEGNDIIKLPQKFLDSVNFGNYELIFHPNKDNKGNIDGFSVEVEKVDSKGEDTPVN